MLSRRLPQDKPFEQLENMPLFEPVLQTIHPHERDKNLQFEPKWHKYTIKNDKYSKYTSVTKIIHSMFPQFNPDAVIKKMMAGKNWNESNKYWGMTPDEIKTQWKSGGEKQSGAGTSLHEDIEAFMNQWLVDEDDNLIHSTHQLLLDSFLEDQEYDDAIVKNDSEEFTFFLDFVRINNHLKPYRTEWMIYHEDIKLAGSVDMTYVNDDGSIDIYDWKRCKDITGENSFGEFGISPVTQHLPHCNFWHYSLQLNVYKAILEDKYGIKVRNLYLVKLHPESVVGSYELIEVADLQREVGDIFNMLKRKQNKVK